MAMMEITENTLTELFSLVRGVDSKISVLCATVTEKEKRCDEHMKTTADHEARIRKIELWKAEQTGTSGFIWRILPMIFGIGGMIAAFVKH